MLGIDIVPIPKIKALIREHSEEFLKRVYTEREISYCQNRKENSIKHFAGRLAAKEAVLKAIGTGKRGKIEWTDIEILSNGYGEPVVYSYGEVLNILRRKNIKKLAVSISHCNDYAVACATAFSAEDVK